MTETIFITGGAGFIGSHVVRLFVTKYPDYNIINIDKLTYAGNLENLKDIELSPNYVFEKCDIADLKHLTQIFTKYNPTGIIHLAAESHVDRSITNPDEFITTNIVGTHNLLMLAKQYNCRFHHVSTDEVYGALDMNPNNKFTETTPYNPHSPYSASKASSDHLVQAYHDTYGLQTTISNCSNNYGPNQFPEKLIPLIINNLSNGQKIPVYGNGLNVRDWLYVEDHAQAIDLIYHNGKIGETYNIGGNSEHTNIDIIKCVIDAYITYYYKRAKQIKEVPVEGIDYPYIEFGDAIKYVTDRKGHDLRYAIDASKIKNDLGWTPSETFTTGMSKTVDWYLNNTVWLNNCTSGDYQKYYNEHYGSNKD